MSFLEKVYQSKLLRKSLLISVLSFLAFIAISMTVALWPSPLPFNDQEIRENVEPDVLGSVVAAKSQNRQESINIETRNGDALHAVLFGGDANITIILMHGVIATSKTVENAAVELQKISGAEVITPDFRGHGQSSGYPFDIEYIGQYEDDLLDIVTFVRNTRPDNKIIIAGHSMGGGVALRYALKEDKIEPDAYLMFAPNFGEGPTERTQTDDASDEQAETFVYFDFRRMIGLLMLNSVGITVLDHLPILYFNFPPQRKDYSFRAVMSAQPVRPYTSDIALQHVNAPLLVVVGENDEVFDASQYEAFVSAHSDGQTVLIEGADHNGVLENAGTFEAIQEWFGNSSFSTATSSLMTEGITASD